ncbi:hypothetical protein [Desulfoluna spongiiphila]|uniref:hypothetical protein n=1 Tax=Desulfoluna spongiiphila TaxID=419481 RepID=UPI001258260D|nr:hypothetical protein [Desulfoluna spongiiphila]VVS91977.1 hypothetical protein DBB_15450 [Desulfoluna spongiiphila]
MYSINRQVIVIKPKTPYLHWVNTLMSPDEHMDIEALSTDCSSYLLPHFDDDKETNRYIKKIYDQIFELELEGWSTDERTWPPKRTYPLFKKWFSIEIHSEVIDVLKTKIEKEPI